MKTPPLQKFILLILVILAGLDAAMMVSVVTSFGSFVDSINRSSNVPGFQGLGTFVGILLSPVYLFVAVSFGALLINIYVKLYAYERVRSKRGDSTASVRNLQVAFSLFLGHLLLCVYFWPGQFWALLQPLSDASVIYLLVGAAIVLYGLYRLIKKFYRSPVFWVLSLLFVGSIVWFINKMDQGAGFYTEVTKPDGTIETVYMFPDGSTSTDMFK